MQVTYQMFLGHIHGQRQVIQLQSLCEVLKIRKLDLSEKSCAGRILNLVGGSLHLPEFDAIVVVAAFLLVDDPVFIVVGFWLVGPDMVVWVESTATYAITTAATRLGDNSTVKRAPIENYVAM